MVDWISRIASRDEFRKSPLGYCPADMEEQSPGVEFVPRGVSDKRNSLEGGFCTGSSDSKLVSVKCIGKCRIDLGCMGEQLFANGSAAVHWVGEICIGKGTVGSECDGTRSGGALLVVGAVCDSSERDIVVGYFLGGVNLERDEIIEDIGVRCGRLDFTTVFLVLPRCIGTEGGGLVAVQVRELVTATSTGTRTGCRLSETASFKASSWSGS